MCWLEKLKPSQEKNCQRNIQVWNLREWGSYTHTCLISFLHLLPPPEPPELKKYKRTFSFCFHSDLKHQQPRLKGFRSLFFTMQTKKELLTAVNSSALQRDALQWFHLYLLNKKQYIVLSWLAAAVPYTFLRSLWRCWLPDSTLHTLA